MNKKHVYEMLLTSIADDNFDELKATLAEVFPGVFYQKKNPYIQRFELAYFILTQFKTAIFLRNLFNHLLLAASQTGNNDIICFLLDYRQLKIIANVKFYYGGALRIACKNGYLDTVKILLFSKHLKTNASLFQSNCYGVQEACKYGQLNIIKYFLENESINPIILDAMPKEELFKNSYSILELEYLGQSTSELIDKKLVLLNYIIEKLNISLSESIQKIIIEGDHQGSDYQKNVQKILQRKSLYEKINYNFSNNLVKKEVRKI